MNPDRINPSAGAAPPDGDDAGNCAQRLSCLLDGELDSDECRSLVERLRRDREACRKWELFNCVGDAMRSADVAAWHSGRFVARVSAALQQEPTVLAPVAASRSASRRWLLPGAGMAAAAVVLIVVGLPSRQAVSPESMAIRAPAPTVASAATPASIERSPRLERYLAAHRELAEPGVMPHSTSYVRTSGAMSLEEGR